MRLAIMAATQRDAHHPPPRRAAQAGIKKATILRAEGGRVHARVGPAARSDAG